MRTGLAVALWLSGFVLMGASPTSGQSLGSYSWQLQPYCNIVTVTVVPTGGVFALSGWDDRCGGASRSAVVGVATPNPDGTLAVGFTVIPDNAGAPAHIDARITLPAANGTWRDSAGTSGTFVLNGAATGAGPRPAVKLGAASIDAQQIQARVVGTCGLGETITAVHADGAVRCSPAPAGPPGIEGPTGVAGPPGTSKAHGQGCPSGTQLQGFTADGHVLCAQAGSGAALNCGAFTSAGVQGWLTANAKTVETAACSNGAFGLVHEATTTAGDTMTFDSAFPGSGAGMRARVACTDSVGWPCAGFPSGQVQPASDIDAVACRQQIFAFAAFAGAVCP